MTDIQRLAKREHLTVGEWVRRAAKYSLPTADIEQMLSEIERGYLD